MGRVTSYSRIVHSPPLLFKTYFHQLGLEKELGMQRKLKRKGKERQNNGYEARHDGSEVAVGDDDDRWDSSDGEKNNTYPEPRCFK